MEMNSQGQRIPSKFILTATWGDVLLDAADFHPVTGCLKGPATSGSAGHYQACHSGEKNPQPNTNTEHLKLFVNENTSFLST